jgi:phosphopantothenoylcysteine decarboxylase/phosphopantothenate--cysteine ligase
MLYGKNIVLGVTGCIAAYKACDIVSRLKKLGANVDVIMTDNACQFVMPLSFETLSGNAVVTDTFKRVDEFDVKHVSLAKKADLFLVAPATANIIGKFAWGIADDMLSTTYMASKAPKVICPAMNTNMYESEAVTENLKTLKDRGVVIVDAVSGRLACGDTGKGKMAEPVDIVKVEEDILQPVQDFKGMRVLVTSGATEEDIDGVRVITNHSSGKMGASIVKALIDRGAEVTLVHGKTSVPVPNGVAKAVSVTTTCQLLDKVKENFDQDLFIMAAAPADYRVKNKSSQKIKSETVVLELEKNPDVAAYVGANKGDKTLVVFSAETENLIENAKGKLKKKNADYVVANDVSKVGTGFYADNNEATIISNSGYSVESGLVTKDSLAHIILDTIADRK